MHGLKATIMQKGLQHLIPLEMQSLPHLPISVSYTNMNHTEIDTSTTFPADPAQDQPAITLPDNIALLLHAGRPRTIFLARPGRRWPQ